MLPSPTIALVWFGDKTLIISNSTFTGFVVFGPINLFALTAPALFDSTETSASSEGFCSSAGGV